MACQPLNAVLKDGTQVFCMQWPATTALENLNVALSVMGPRFASFVDGTADFKDVIGFTMSADQQQYTPLLKRFTNGADGEDRMEFDYPVRAIRRVEIK